MALALSALPSAVAAQTTLYLRGSTASGVAGYRHMIPTAGASATTAVTTTVASGTKIQWTDTAGGASVAWISPPLAASYTFNAAATCNVWAIQSGNINTGVRCEIHRYTTTESATFCAASYGTPTEISRLAVTQYNWTCTQTNTTFAAGDRIVLKMHAINAGGTMGAGTQTGHYDGAVAQTASSFVTVPGTPSFRTTVVADGGAVGNATLSPGDAATNLDAFTLATGGSDTVTAITVSLAAGTAGSLSLVEITASNGTQLAAVANPASDTVTLTPGTPIAVSASATTYYVRVTPRSHADMPTPPGSSYAVTGVVTGIASGNGHLTTLGDSTSATLTIDNLSPTPAIGGLAGTPGLGQVALSWTTEPTDADFTTGGEVVVVAKPSAAPTEVPAEGTDYAGGEGIGAAGAFVACVAAPGARACTASGLSSANAYYFVAFARDARMNYSVGSSSTGPHTPTAPTITTSVTNGADPSPPPYGPVASPTPVDVDGFDVTFTNGSDSISSVRVTLSTTDGVGTVEITDSANGVLGAVTSPASTTPWIDLGLTPITAEGSYKIRVTPLSALAMPAPQGGTYSITARVTDITVTNSKSVEDTGSGTLTIDNLSPANATDVSGTPGNQQVQLSWSNPADADLAQTVVLRKTSAFVAGDVPTEGKIDYAVGGTAGSATVACVVTDPGASCTDDGNGAGLANGTAYHYVVFSRDGYGNYSTGQAAPTTYTPAGPSTAITDGSNPTPAPYGPVATPTPIDVDGFDVAFSNGTDAITAVEVTLSTRDGVGTVAITDASDVVLGAVTNPASTTPSITLTTQITVAGSYKIRVTPLSATAMPPAPGGTYAITARITDVTVTYGKSVADTGSGTLTIDNQSPSVVTDLTLTWTGNPAGTTRTLAWTNPSGSDGVVILRSTASNTATPAEGTTYSAGNTLGASTVVWAGAATSYVDTVPDRKVTYYYEVFAYDAYRNYASGVEQPAGAPPPIPGTPAASAQTTAAMTVTWTASTGATMYMLELYTDEALATLFATYTPATNSQAVSGLSANTRYWMRVDATGPGGTSDWSPTGLGTTVSGPPGDPTYSGTTSTGTTVSWTAPSGTAPISSYALDRATNSAFTENLYTTNGITGTSTPVSGLAPNTTYWFRVRAVNAGGTSASSNPTSVTTSSAASTTLATGSDPAPGATPICPGDAAAYVDQFTFTSDPTADTVSSLVAGLGAGAGAAISSLEIRDASGASLSPARIALPSGDTATFSSASLPSPLSPGATYRLYATPLAHAPMTAGSYTLVARVTSFDAASHAETGADSAGSFAIDNAPLAEAAWGTVTPGDNQIALQWTNPGADGGAALTQIVVLRRRTTTPFTDSAIVDGMPPPGAGTTTADGSYVVYSQVGTAGAPVSIVDTGVVNGNDYVYRLYALDACGNWNAGASSGPYRPAPAFFAEGSTSPGAPMISIVNPLEGGTVSGTFRVQIRVHNPLAGGVDTLSGLALSTDNGSTWPVTTFTALTGLDTLTGTTVTGRTYEAQIAAAAAQYNLRARVSNAAATGVRSNLVSVSARAGGGTGMLLVRDNSSQLCSDCHALKPHSSETSGSTARGSWSTTCRDCHTPHATRNIALVNEQITPPEIEAAQTPRTVTFYNKTGQADGSYASATGATGPCQVCHTRTTYYLSTGGGASHYTSPCAGCHTHDKGFKGTCTTCHGDEGRTSIDGADPNQKAAPPAVATKPGQTVVATPGGGAHVAHVNQITLRATPLACAHCHPSPSVHQATTQTDVAWTGLASGGGVTPTPLASSPVTAEWATSPTPTCTNYCHGASLTKGGGTNLVTPAFWTGTTADCGTCHAVLPPIGGASAGVHPQNRTCADCHGLGYGWGAAGEGSLTADAKGRHIDGTLDRPYGCTACHGNLTKTSGTVVLSGSAQAAPGWDADSVDTRGSALRTDVGVGAHVKHVNSGMMSAKACAVCHGSTPPDTETPAYAHADASVAIGWGSPADAKSVSPSWTSPTCTNYCHSTGLPIGGSVTTRSPVWTSTTALLCSDCHDAIPPTNAHARHAASTTGNYGIGCKACHATTAASSSSIVTGGGAHVSGGNDVGFDSADPYAAPGGYSTTLYTCDSTYCHSDGTDRTGPDFAANVSRAWNAGGGGCTACHQAGTALATGSHPAHVNQAGTYATTFGCQTCHASTTADGSSIASTTLHVNMAADVTPAADLKYQDPGNTVSNSCTTYCHSSGQGGAATPQHYSDMAWGTPLTNDCKQCHGRYSPADPGFTTSYGAPNYANGGTAAATANSHKSHVASGADCYVCHKATANTTGTAIVAGTTHLDGSRQVSFDATAAGASATYSNDADKRCSNVSCHGVALPQWGGPAMECDDCHLGASDQNDYTDINNKTAAIISSFEWAAVGHGQTTLEFSEFSSATDRCVYCHDNQNTSASHKRAANPFRLRGAAADGGATALYDTTTEYTVVKVCLNCHGLSGANGVDPDGAGGQAIVGPATKRIDAIHHGAKHGATNDGGQRCWDCHDPHGDGTNVKMIGSDVLADATDVHGFGGTRAAQPVTFTLAAIGGYTDSVGPPYNGVCQVCHATTKYWRADGTLPHNADQDCIDCHSHQQPPDKAFEGAGSCSACHLAPAAANNQDVEDFTYGTAPKAMIDGDDWAAYGHGATSAYAQSGNPGAAFPVTETVEGCYYCHAPDTAIPGGNGDTSTHDEINTGVDAFRLTNTGGAFGKNGVCLVCHAASGATGFDPDGANTVFTSSKLATRRISAAHYGADHVAGGKGGAFCWDCHDPHGDANYAVSPLIGQPIAYMIQQLPSVTHGGPTGWGASPTVAANAVDFVKGTPGSDLTAFDGLDYVRTSGAATGVCQVCHSGTTFWTSTGGGTGHNGGGVRCVACHRHEQGTTDAFKQATACDACHAAPPANGKHAFHVGAATPAYGDTAAHATAEAYAYGCGKCHTTTGATHFNDVGGTAADPFAADVAFDWASGATPYAPSTAATYASNGLVFKTSPGTCATYCHSDGQPLGAPAPTYRSPTWSAASSMDGTCTSCHGGDETSGTALGTGKHPQHITTGNPVGTAYGCVECHGTVVSGNRSIGDRTLHVNGGTKNVAFLTKNGQTSAAYASPACDSNYCHSSGRDPSFTDAGRYANVAWSQAGTLGCTGCHGRTQNLYGAPDYADGATLPEANSHAIHTGGGNDATTCEHCHTNTVTSAGTALKSGAPHTDGYRNVDVLAVYDLNSTSANYVPATKQCSNVSCHGPTATPVWGSPLGCGDCHGAPPAGGRHAKHDQTGTFTAYGDTTNQTTSGSYGFACATCHAGTHASSTAAGTSAGTAHYADVTVGLGYTGGTTTTSETGPGGSYFGYYTDRSCTTASCHSNGGPLQSDGTNAAPTYAPTTWSSTLGCDGCHGYGDTPGTMSAPHARHVRNAANGYAYACLQCHQPTTTAVDTVTDKTKHADGVNDQVSFLSSMNPAGSYDTSTWTCSSTYCHSNGSPLNGTIAYKSPKWTDAPGSLPADCTGCHGGASGSASAIATNKHPQHITASAAIGSAYGCVECHNATVSGDTTILSTSGYGQHVDGGAKDVGFPTRNGQSSAAYASPACDSNYCHSNGRDPGFTDASRYANVTWSQAGTLGCTGCHGRTDNLYGAPDYDDGSSLAEANSHDGHTANGNEPATCQNCHVSTVTSAGTGIKAGAPHTDGVRSVTILAGWDNDADPANNYDPSTKKCSNVSCHGTGQPVWGDPATATCLGCHGAAADADQFATSPTAFWSNGTAAKINTAEWTYSGHGRTSGNYDSGSAATGNVAANFPTTGSVTGTAECRYCHDETVAHNPGAAGNPYRLRGVSTGGVTAAWSTSAPNAVCLNCHGSGSSPGVTPSSQVNKKATVFVAETHYGSKHASGEGGQFCWDCHDAHGDRISGSGNILMIRSQVFAATDGTYGVDPTQKTVNFTTVAANPPAVGKLVEATNATRTGLCQACHNPASTTPTRYWRWDGTDDPDGAGGAAAYTSVHDVSEPSTAYCLRCHSHSAKFETGSCKSCHTSTAADTDAFTGTAGTATGFWNDYVASNVNETEWMYSGHGKTGVTSYDQSGNPAASFPTTVPGESECRYCHDDALAHVSGSRASIYGNPYLLRGVSTGGTTAAWSTTAPNAVCLNCHESASSPGVTPPGLTNKTATTWGPAAHYGAKHTTTGEGGKFCWDCHDPHGDRPSNTNSAGYNIEMIRSQVFFANDGTYGINPTLKNVTWYTRAGTAPAVGKLVEATNATRVGLCQACHNPASSTPTKYWRWDGTDQSANPSTHNATEADASYCVKCHPHDDNFKGQGTCLSCHGGTQGSRVAVTADFTRANRHVSAGSATSIVTNYDCILCHAEGDLASSGTGATADIRTVPGNHGGDTQTVKTVDLRDVDSPNGTGIAAAWTGSRGTPLGNGTTHTAVRDAMDTFCMNCHDADGAATVTVKATDDGMLTGTGYWIGAAAGQVSRASNVVTVNTTATHGLAVNNTVALEVPTEAGFPPGVKVVTSVPTTTRFTYAETAANATSTRALKFIRIAQSNSGATTRASGSSTISVTTTQAHGFALGDKILLRTGSNNTTSGTSSYTHSYYFRAGTKTVATVPSTTQFTYVEDTAASPNPTSAQTSNQVLLFTKSIDRAVTPFNSADRLTGSTNEGAALKAWRWQANGRLIDVKSQFNSANAVGSGWASHHNLRQFELRYGARSTAYWPDAGWTTWVTKEGENIQTTGETAGLHCSDCHLNETSAHGTTGNYYMLSNASGADTAFTGQSTTSSTDVCVKCHAAGTYGIGNTSTASRTGAHNASGSRCQNWTTTGFEIALSGNGTTPTLTCLGCHGGLSPGMIHGTNSTYNPGKSATWTSRRFRFMGTGGAMRWYTPNASATGSDASWTTNQGGGCYTQDEALDTFGGCSNHNSGISGAADAIRARPLDY